MPLYCTAVGKAILSTRTEEELSDYFNKVKLDKYTKNTITTNVSESLMVGAVKASWQLTTSQETPSPLRA